VRFYEPTDGAVVCELEYAAYLAAHRIEFLSGGGGGARTGEAGSEGRSVVIDELIGESELIREVRKNILIAAGLDLSVLIIGEPGTGKELVARGIHKASGRANGPFVDVNCAAFNPNLIESELFGHEKGAFTGALSRKPGRFERANGGTLFLDEIGDLPASLQAKLLRFLQQRTIERLGGREEIPVDVRIVCATHQNLREHITTGSFREDLFYRLAEIVVTVPPLRERPGDAALLAHALVRRFADELKRGRLGIGDEAIAAIERHRWPGNVRELENVIKRAVILADGQVIHATDLALEASATEDEPLNLREARDAAERREVVRALARANGNLSKAADLLGISRPTLYDLLNRFGMRKQEA
jgi:two-component system NtrC family response regulator